VSAATLARAAAPLLAASCADGRRARHSINGPMASFRPDRLKLARETVGLTQQQAAEHIGVSQTYLALMETGRRRVTEQVGLKMMDLYRLGPTVLPLRVDDLESLNSASLAKALANLGYPGFRHLLGGRRDNPAVVLLAAISRDDVEVRVVESLPGSSWNTTNLTGSG
jgi:DNA-binding XRE family transcriptional regulator